MPDTSDHTPAYVVIGHVTRDVLAGGVNVAGGTALYSSLTANRLGLAAGIVTALAEPDLFLLDVALREGVRCATCPSAATTVFANNYQGTQRQQMIHAVGAQIEPADVPQSWTGAPILHLGPVAQEISSDGSWQQLFSAALIGVTPQGWLRVWDDAGRVSPTEWRGAADLLAGADVLVMSAEDVGNDADLLMKYVRLAKMAVVTAGPDAATIFERGREVATVPALRSNPVDFTGAGDVFTTGFLVRYHETGDPVAAAYFAHAAAAIAIEAEGASGIPTRFQVEQRLEQN